MSDVEKSANEQVEERMRHMAEQVASLQKDNLRLTRELERANRVSTTALELHWKAGWDACLDDQKTRARSAAPEPGEQQWFYTEYLNVINAVKAWRRAGRRGGSTAQHMRRLAKAADTMERLEAMHRKRAQGGK